MTNYFETVKEEFKDWKMALPVVIFTLIRLIYGYAWVSSGFGKLGTWFSDGKFNSTAKIGTLITNIAGPKVTSFDPLYLNKAWAWVAQTFFQSMPGLTDALVVFFEISVGLAMILGFRIFWFALIAMFMNVQFLAAGSFNNFGYIWTNLAMFKFAKQAELLGLSGYLKYSRKGNNSLSETRTKHQAA